MIIRPRSRILIKSARKRLSTNTVQGHGRGINIMTAEPLWRFDQLVHRERYRDAPRRRSENGQMKLIMSEIELLWLLGVFDERNRDKRVQFVYVGSAPGDHIPALARLAGLGVAKCEFELFDPARHCCGVKDEQTFKVHEREFRIPDDTQPIDGFALRVLINDIRNSGGRVINPNRGPDHSIVREDQEFTNSIADSGAYHVLFSKRREPFPGRGRYESFRLPRPDVQLLQVMNNPQSIERRDLVTLPITSEWHAHPLLHFEPLAWDVVDLDLAREVEEKMAFYNQRLRRRNQSRLVRFIIEQIPASIRVEFCGSSSPDAMTSVIMEQIKTARTA